MEQHYKTFMNKQHPSEDLLAETISKAKMLSGEEQGLGAGDGLDNRVFLKDADATLKRSRRKWQYGMVAFAVFCLIAGVVWQWNTRIVYPDLITEFSPDEDSDYIDKREEEFGEERNSYLAFDSSLFYVFDKNAERTEVKVGEGNIVVQTGTVKIAGNQLLYQIKSQYIKGTEVFLGKLEDSETEHLYAAFDLGEVHYYLESENVTEKDMTAYIKGLIRENGVKR